MGLGENGQLGFKISHYHDRGIVDLPQNVKIKSMDVGREHSIVHVDNNGKGISNILQDV